MISDINIYQEEAQKTAKYGTAEYPFLLLAEEAGEVVGKLNKFARKNVTSSGHAVTFARFEKKSELRESMIKELGDVAWAWVICCQELEVDPAEVLGVNIAKLRDRHKRGVINGSGDNR